MSRIGAFIAGDMTVEALDKWVAQQQITRTTARALGGMKRKAAAPKVPKPRKHKVHCYCTGSTTQCCRCLGAKCIKPPPKGRKKKSKP